MRVTTADRSVIEEETSGKADVPNTPQTRAPRRAGSPPDRLRIDGPALIQALWGEINAQGQRWILWSPVAFGIGAAIYFELRAEPSLGFGGTLAVLALASAFAARLWGRSQTLMIGVSLLAFGCAGFADAGLSTTLAKAPVVPEDIGVVHVEGWVVDVASPSAGRARVLLAPTRISRLQAAALPYRVRLTLQEGGAPSPGSAIRTTAILNPPPGPASPGAYDFARDAWFERVGGVGLALTPPASARAARPGWPLALEMGLNGFRWMLAQRLADDVQSLMGEAKGAGLAATVATSHENWLSQDDADDLRNSGLAHMLAIAGLHTAAVTGFVFAAIRLGIAAWPWLALRVSGKKVAALGGLLAAGAYLAISGAHPPARRAAITASVAFLAILFDRRAISLRSLAIAALIILALQPVAIVEPGFQMSFCATAALVAMAEIWPRHPGAIAAPWFIAWPQKLKDWLLALVAVSLVAGAATAPFAIQNFNRMASYGLPANLFADLIASALMMPALVVAVIGEALGVDPLFLSPFLAVAGWSSRAILGIAHVFSAAPSASRTLASAPWPALPLSFAAIVFACLWKGRLRWAVAPLACAVLLWPRPPPPSGWIAADGANAAIAIDGRSVVLKPVVRKFASDAWAARRGLILPFAPDLEADLAFDCDRNHCAPRYGVKPALGAWWSRRPPAQDQLDALCRDSDIVILRAAVAEPHACADALVLGPAAFARGGSGEIFPTSDGRWRIEWSEPLRGVRPWTRRAVVAGAPDSALSDNGG